jgi:hypothetical protein
LLFRTAGAQEVPLPLAAAKPKGPAEAAENLSTKKTAPPRPINRQEIGPLRKSHQHGLTINTFYCMKSPSTGGRPEKDPATRRSACLKCYLTEAEKTRIQTKCELAGLSASDFLRALALGKQINKRGNPADLKKIREALGKIGGNINQIVRAVNSGQDFNEARFKKMAVWLVKTIEEL